MNLCWRKDDYQIIYIWYLFTSRHTVSDMFFVHVIGAVFFLVVNLMLSVEENIMSAHL